jgi:hypothetical protein
MLAPDWTRQTVAGCDLVLHLIPHLVASAGLTAPEPDEVQDQVHLRWGRFYTLCNWSIPFWISECSSRRTC